MSGELLICGFLGFGVCFGIIPLTLEAVRRCRLADRVEEFHHGPRGSISRLGGIGLAVAFVSVKFLGIAFLDYHVTLDHVIILTAALAMFGLGLWDDLRPLGARRKLGAQLVIASAAYFMGLGIFHLKIPFTSEVLNLGFWSWPVTVLWIVGMTNLINLIDGMDGLAAGISLMLMVLLAVEGGAIDSVCFVAAGMTGALLAFLFFNFPPAKIYMGDGGAYLLGSLIGLLTITSSHKGTVMAALVAPLFVMALPILDTSLAILRRGLQGLPLFRADRRHLHHRMLQSGLSRRSAVLGFYLFTAFFLLLGLAVFLGRGEYLPLALGGGVLAVLLAAGRLSFSREWFAVGRVLGNSLQMRGEIHYALAQTRWLALEGARCENLAGLCEDAVFIARKLGFASVRVQLEDGERAWRITGAEGDREHRFRRRLPDHEDCFIELTWACRNNGIEDSPADDGSVPKEVSILSDLLAEGWGKAVAVWEKQTRLPVCFESRSVPAAGRRARPLARIRPPAVTLDQS